MWLIRDLTHRRMRLDFSSSGQAAQDVTQLLADGEVLANAMELASWTEERVQLQVCQDCGIEGCAPGGWVAPRLAGDLVVLLPAFASMCSDEYALDEYRPPAVVERRGIPVLTAVLAQGVSKRGEWLPWPHELPLMTGAELVRWLQWEAPAEVLGRLPQAVAIRQDLVLASSMDDHRVATALVAAEIERVAKLDGVLLSAMDPSWQPIALHLEGPRFPEWNPAVMRGEEIALRVGDLIATPASDTP